jgi:nucleoside-diphosphate kinase
MGLVSAELSCVIVKPDGVGQALVGKILARLEEEGFRLLALRMVRPKVETMAEFYGEHRGKPFYDGLMKFMTSGPFVVTAWTGENAIARIRALVGATDPKKAAAGTLRATWGTDHRRNLIHASDSPASGQRETALFFTPAELAPYDPQRWAAPDMAPPVQ